jgi:predicted AlkP superfamily phosphohydrolase/phosphomutase
MSRVLVIGLDGATLDLVEPWAKSGRLPHLKVLMKNGCYGTLNSVYPVLSSAAWASFMTGLNPGKHGVYDFFRRDASSYQLRLVNRSFIHGQPVWNALGDQDIPGVVINVPMTYPPEPVNGVIVTGLGTPNNKPFTLPVELSEDLTRRGYVVNKQVSYQPGKETEFLTEVYETTDKLASMSIDLMNSNAWGFFMVVFRDTDELGHFFWRYMDAKHPAYPGEGPFSDAILAYYQKVDTYIGKLVEQAGEDTTVLIMSDHGHGPLYRDVLLNEWLKQKGYLVTKQKAEKRGFFSRLGITRSNISKTLRGLGLGIVETWIKDILGDRINVLPRTSRVEFPNAVDWSKTRAYSFGYHGQIYINLQGREPEGIVAPQDYESVLAMITADLYAMVDPHDNGRVVDKVLRKDSIFSGPHVDIAPDLTVVMRDFSYITRQGYEFGDQPGEIFLPPNTHESGSHRMEGMLIISGKKAARKEERMEASDLVDLMPTILHLAGCPVPDNVDGKVLEHWIETNTSVQFKSDSGQSETSGGSEVALPAEEEEEMVNRLKGLGYL